MIYDLYERDIFPSRKEPEDFSLPIGPCLTGGEYLGIVRDTLPGALDALNPTSWCKTPGRSRSWAGRLLACEVISSPEWDRLSDYNPVSARFGRREVSRQICSASDRISGGNADDESPRRELPRTDHPKNCLPIDLIGCSATPIGSFTDFLVMISI